MSIVDQFLEKYCTNKMLRYRERAKEVAEMVAATPDSPQRIFIEGIEFAAKFKVRFRLDGI